MDIVLYYIKTRFTVSLVSIFVIIGVFALIRDVPILKKKKLNKESTIAKTLGYLYIFGSIAMLVVANII